MRFVPSIGGPLVVDLPGERIAATVADVVRDDLVIVELTAQPLMKSHFYKLGEVLWCNRVGSILGDRWEVMEHRPIVVAPPKSRKSPKPKPVTRPKKKATTRRKPRKKHVVQ